MKKSIYSLAILSSLFVSGAMAETNYDIKITNITKGQTFTPILALTHTPDIRAFTLGEPAIPQLVSIAESGNTEPAISALTGLSNIGEVKDSGGVLAPGESVNMILSGGENITHVTIVSMLIPTNDTFFAINAGKLPMDQDSVTYRAIAYDAGSEENDELCANIPGPPGVCEGEGDSEADGEGFVHIQSGIHGIGDISAARYDWRNSVAEITITKVQ